MNPEAADNNREGRRLYRVLWGGYLTLFPMTALFIATALFSHSASIGVICVQSVISIVINAFALYALRRVLRSTVHSFAYGAGKLENFSAFLCGVFYVPSGMYLMYDAGQRIVDAPEVGYALSQAAVAVSALRMLVLYVMVRRLMKQSSNPSPLLRSYLLDYRVCLLNDIGVLIAFAIALALIRFDLPAIGHRIDPLIAVIISLYMIWIGILLVRHNFRSLIDLPLSEGDQVMILRALTRHYPDYEGIGTVFTRSSGTRRFVEIELEFDGGRTVEYVLNLSRQMEDELAADIPGLAFRIIPIRSGQPQWSTHGHSTAGPVRAGEEPA